MQEREGPPFEVEADAEVAGFDSSLVFHLNHSHFSLCTTLHHNFSSTPHQRPSSLSAKHLSSSTTPSPSSRDQRSDRDESRPRGRAPSQ